MISYKIRSLLALSCMQMIFGLAFYYMGRSITNITEDACRLQFTRTSLFDIGMKYATDKVYVHHYDNLYEKYLSRYRNTAVRLLEIGLGCGMERGVGASARTWREYFGPKANIHFLEFNETCGRRWHAKIGRKVRHSF